jgi:uncharacterized protein (DUF433 family)
MTTTILMPPEVATLISVDAAGMARIAGSRIKVADLAIEHTRAGQAPEQIVAAYPHLTMAQVEAALAYYYAHRAVVEAQIAETAALVEQMRAEADDSPFAARMRSEGHLPAQDQAA